MKQKTISIATVLIILIYVNQITASTNYAASNNITLTLVLDNYPDETTWELKDFDENIIASGGPYANPGDIGATITENITVQDGCYAFEINDLASDGICCQFGLGSYQITNDSSGEVLAEGGEFLDTEVKSICINAELNAVDGEWKTLKTGAGGWLTGLHIHPSGSPIYTRSDVGGAYRFEENTESWTQIVTEETMPSSDVYWDKYSGVLSIVSAPSDANVAYMAYYNTIYKSTNQGANWERTNFPNIEIRPNDDSSKLSGERLAVDPSDADHVFFGSIDDGLWETTNAGVNWNLVSAVPPGTADRGIRSIVFDPNSGTIGGLTKSIYISVDGEGIFSSINAGATWTNISPSSYWPNNGPHIMDLEVANDGDIYISGNDHNIMDPNDPFDDTFPPFGVLRYDGSQWTQIFLNNINMGEIAIDPFNDERIYIFSDGFTETYRTLNGDSNNPNWTFLNYDLTADNIPWLEWYSGAWFTLGEVTFDPVIQDKIWISHGTGSYIATDINGSDFIWEEESVNQEHLVSNDVISFSNGNVLTAHWDFSMFLHTDLDAYAEEMKPTNRFNYTWDIDQSPTDENFLVAIVEDERFCCFDDGQARNSSYSEDGGETWTRFPTMPGGEDNLIFGLISVSANDNDNWVWLPNLNMQPYVTFDKGQSWTQVNLPGSSPQCCLDAVFFKRRALTADRVLPNTFYIYDWGDGSIFKSSDGGLNWIKSDPDVVNAFGFNAKLMSVPGKANHLLFASGPEEAIQNIAPLKISEDGGMTWTTFAGTDEVLNVAIGKEAPGQNYPAIFIYGRVFGELGYFKSIDKGNSWLKLPSFPLGIYDFPSVMEADMNIHGRLYIGYKGNGFVYFTEEATTSQIPHLTVSNNALELLPNNADSYFMLEGNMTNYNIELLDVDENVTKSFNNTSTEHIITDSSLGPDDYFLRVVHETNSNLLFQTIIK